jgi:hypothetical protein
MRFSNLVTKNNMVTYNSKTYLISSNMPFIYSSIGAVIVPSPHIHSAKSHNHIYPSCDSPHTIMAYVGGGSLIDF